MKSSRTKIVALVGLSFSGALAFLILTGVNPWSRSTSRIDREKPASAGAPINAAQVREAYGKLPLAFEANRGQTEEATNFRSRGAGYTLSLSPTEAVFLLTRGPKESPTVLRMNLVGANPGAPVEGRNELEGKVNYLIGNDPAQWRTNIPIFSRVHYSEVYPGVDVIYYGNQRRLEYDFVVAPGSDTRAIALEFAGAPRIEVEAATGDLLIAVGEETIRQHKPIVYQKTSAGRREVEGRYALRSGGLVGIELGKYDASAALIIDPVLEYSTFLGGNFGAQARAIAVDSTGSAYVTGVTSSTDFPTANPAQSTNHGQPDVFVTKLNAAGSALVYSTYLGGGNQEYGLGIAVDSTGSAYVTGWTFSANFPTVNAFQPTKGHLFTDDAFVAKLSPSGSALVYSTYLGGENDDQGNDIAVDSSGNAYVTGFTESSNFPTANALQSTFGGRSCERGDAFVTKFNAAGAALVYSTYLGGTRDDEGRSIAVDSAGNAYVTGFTKSTNFPTANAFQSTYGDGDFDGGCDFGGDAFVTKFNAAGSALVYSTYLGGSDTDGGDGIAVDSSGSAYVTGGTNSTNFPIANALQSALKSLNDIFVTKFNPAGSALVYSTYLGGDSSDAGLGIAVNATGNAYITGFTQSTNFPTANAFKSTLAPGDFYGDAFVTKFNAAGSALVYSSYLGGDAEETGYGIAVDSAGNAYVAGFTASRCFPTTTGAFDTTLSMGNGDAFITKISETAPPSALSPCPSQLLNLATRLRVLPGDSALIAGFIITGSDTKRVIIRGIGPSLTSVQGALADPTLQLFNGNNQQFVSNDDWITNRTEVEETGLAPGHDLESAIVVTLVPGAYTAVLRGKNNGTGTGVVEVYDLNPSGNSILANIGSRGFVDTGDNVMIGGFIVGGSGQPDARVVVRGIGPSLAAFGITNALQNPTLELKNANGATLTSNDDWQQGQPTEINALGLAPSDSRESALVAALPHGNYTAILRGKNNTTGVAVVEVYNVP
ncbi:MAG: SBBP repeat-containing protein [Chthoniobacterales bacterium]